MTFSSVYVIAQIIYEIISFFFCWECSHGKRKAFWKYGYKHDNIISLLNPTAFFSDKLDLPIIQNITTSLSSGKIWANMSCTAEQKSGAPLFYRPTFEVLWKYPRDARYSVIQNGSNLILEEVDCSSENSQPLFCSVRELKGSYSDSQHFYPHTLCKSSAIYLWVIEFKSSRRWCLCVFCIKIWWQLKLPCLLMIFSRSKFWE